MKTYEENQRYQFQPWYVKAYRWLKWMPIHWGKASWNTVWWLLQGAPPLTIDWDDNGDVMNFGRMGYLRHIWAMERSQAAFRMGHWFTTEECIQRIEK